GERADDELARFHGADGASHFFHNAAVLVSERRGLRRGLNASVRPEVGSADAGCRHSNDGIRRLDDFRIRALLETYVARTVEDSSLHDFSLVGRSPVSVALILLYDFDSAKTRRAIGRAEF